MICQGSNDKEDQRIRELRETARGSTKCAEVVRSKRNEPTEGESERRGPTRRARGSRAQKVSRVRAQGDERNEHSLFPVPRQFYEYEIRGRSVGRTAAVHAARFAQSSQTRPSYWLCIRPPASPGISLSLCTSRWCRSCWRARRTYARARACDTQRSPLLCGKSQTALCYCSHNCFTVKWQWDGTITVINSIKMSIYIEWSISIIIIEE